MESDHKIILSGLTSSEFFESVKCLVDSAVKNSMREIKEETLLEKYLSPDEVRKLFQPAVTRGTIDNWSKAGHLKKYSIGNKTFYKYSEILGAVKQLKRYSLKEL